MKKIVFTQYWSFPATPNLFKDYETCEVHTLSLEEIPLELATVYGSLASRADQRRFVVSNVERT